MSYLNKLTTKVFYSAFVMTLLASPVAFKIGNAIMCEGTVGMCGG